MVNEDDKKTWLEALRSGKYEQVTECLHRGGAYCCLGVLWDCTGREWTDKPWGVAQNLVNGRRFTDMFLDEFGIPKETSEELARLNDTGKSFAEIADFIEKEIP